MLMVYIAFILYKCIFEPLSNMIKFQKHNTFIYLLALIRLRTLM